MHWANQLAEAIPVSPPVRTRLIGMLDLATLRAAVAPGEVYIAAPVAQVAPTVVALLLCGFVLPQAQQRLGTHSTEVIGGCPFSAAVTIVLTAESTFLLDATATPE